MRRGGGDASVLPRTRRWQLSSGWHSNSSSSSYSVQSLGLGSGYGWMYSDPVNLLVFLGFF